jgi:hypothetical protein
MMLFGFAGDAFYIAGISGIALSCILVFPLTAMTKYTDIVKGHRPSFGIGAQVHTGTTGVLGISGGIIYFLLTNRTMLLLFHIHSLFPFTKGPEKPLIKKLIVTYCRKKRKDFLQ